MDNNSRVYLKEGSEEQLELHPGFRFHPTDQELITYYLLPKTLDARFVAIAIGEADLRKVEPWELPWKAKMGEEEWYFFSLKERRYPTGMRTHRATDSGYWKATGKDKEIYGGKGDVKSKTLVGMRKTLVFYQGRAPKGVKSNWVMHEFRLEGDYSIDNLPKSAQNGWVISRVFNKDSSGKKTHISALVGSNAQGDEQIHLRPPQLQQEEEPPMPPLTDSSPYNHSACDIKPAIPKSSHLGDDLAGSDDRPWPFAPEDSTFPYYSDHLQFSDCSFFDHEQSILKLLLDGDGNYSFAKDTGPSRGGDDGGGGEIGNDFLSDECINSFFG